MPGIFVEDPIYKKPKFWRWLVGFVLIFAFLVAFWPEIAAVWNFLRGAFNGNLTNGAAAGRGVGIVGFIALAVILSFIVSVLFVSQFVLPVQSLEERSKVFDRMLRYFANIHGPAIFIRNAQQIARSEELQSSQPGVAFVDLCSAIALERHWVAVTAEGAPTLRTLTTTRGYLRPSWRRAWRSTSKEAPVRVAGPGIVFTEWGEKVRGVADLRRQFRLTPKVMVRTSDGFDVRSNVFVLFSLGEAPEVLKVAYIDGDGAESLCTIQVDEKKKLISGFNDDLDDADKAEIHRYANSHPSVADTDSGEEHAPATKIRAPYVFDDERVFGAIYSTARDVKDDHLELWSDLPSRVAIEVYRDMLSLERFNDLYKPDTPGDFPFFQTFRPKFVRRMRNLGVLSFQLVRRKDGAPLQVGMKWDESQLEIYPARKLRSSKVLRDRGIRMIAAGFPELEPIHEGVRQQLVDYWQANWQQEEQLVTADHLLEAMRTRAQAKAEAQKDMIYSLTQMLKTTDIPREALMIRFFQTLDKVAGEPRTRQLVPESTLFFLGNMRQMLLSDQGETG